MPSQGPNSPGTLVNDSSNGGAVAWSNPSNAAASDDARATCTLTVFAGQLSTQYLKVTNFGFTIPADATIDGIVVEVEKSRVGFACADTDVLLVKAGSPTGDDKAVSTGWAGGGVDAYTTYGGSTDLWGTTWTAAQINSSNFGLVFSAQAVGSSEARVDHIRITVHYTETPVVPSSTPSNEFDVQDRDGTYDVIDGPSPVSTSAVAELSVVGRTKSRDVKDREGTFSGNA